MNRSGLSIMLMSNGGCAQNISGFNVLVYAQPLCAIVLGMHQ